MLSSPLLANSLIAPWVDDDIAGPADLSTAVRRTHLADSEPYTSASLRRLGSQSPAALGASVDQDASRCVRRSGAKAGSSGGRGVAMSNSALLPFQPESMSASQLAAVSFLARYSGHTHELYTYELRRWCEWCEANRLDPLIGIQRAHVELYVRHLVQSGPSDSSVNTMMNGVRGFLPVRSHRRTARLRGCSGADRGLPRDPARSSRPASGRQGQQARDHAADRARSEGPLVLRPTSGMPIDRRDCYCMVVRIAKEARIPRHISPHSLRHAAITNALDAGVPLRDAQILARHADPRTTEHYDRARGNLDRHGVHFLTATTPGFKR